MTENYPISVKTLNLSDNNIKTEIIKRIEDSLNGTMNKKEVAKIEEDLKNIRKMESSIPEVDELVKGENSSNGNLDLNIKSLKKNSTKKLYENLMLSNVLRKPLITNTENDNDLLHVVPDVQVAVGQNNISN